jgi:hypothetical protein
MSPLEYSPKDAGPAARSSAVRFLFRTNPFYLLSAMCMLGGCLALTNSLSWTSIRLERLLALIVTLNLYEGLLLALGLYLLARRGIVRDGLMLLFLEALFLVDAAFLNVEVFAIDVRVGMIANAIVFVLAVVKLSIVFRAMRLPLDGAFLLILVQLAVLFGTPGIFAYVTRGGDGALPPGLAYAAWWALGGVAALSVVLLRGARLRELLGEAAPGDQWVRAVIRRSFVWLPFVSLLVHLIMAHWVYDAHLHAAYVAPLLLGLAVMLAGAAPSALMKPSDLTILRVLLPALAVALSLDAPEALRAEPFGPASRLVLTPLIAALVVAYVVYVCLFLPRYALRMLAAAAATVAAFAVAPTPGQVAAAGQQWSEWAVGAIGSLLSKIIPKTTTGWGLTAVGAAFAFLGLGAAISLKKTPESKEEGT